MVCILRPRSATRNYNCPASHNSREEFQEQEWQYIDYWDTYRVYNLENEKTKQAQIKENKSRPTASIVFDLQ